MIAEEQKEAKVERDERDTPEPEKALVKDFKRRIEACHTLNRDRFKQYEQNRQYVTGRVHDDGASGLVRTNLIFSTIATLLPQTYAKDPEIGVSPSEAVDPSQYKLYKGFAKTLDSVLNRKFVRDARLKRRMKSAVRAAMTCQIGWLKVSYQKKIEEDPVILARIADAQDNLKRLEAAQEAATDPDKVGVEDDLAQANLQALLRSLQENVEVVIEHGLAIDRVLTESILVLDASIRDFDDYERASAIAQEIWFTKDGFEETFGYSPTKKATVFKTTEAGKNVTEGGASASSLTDNSTAFYCVYEIWDKRTNTVYTWAKGEEGWCRDPYRPQRLGRRWYPFFALAFNPVDGQFYGLADVELLIELQDEYNRTRTNYAEHRQHALPVRVVRKGGSLTPEDVLKIQNAKLNEIVVLEGSSAAKLQDDLATLDHVPIDPAVYDTQPIRGDIEMVSGAMDSVRGSVLKAKTATEAEIMREGLMSRTGERQDTIEDVILAMCEYSAEILLQELDTKEVVEMAGAQAVWPTLSREQVFDLVNVQIKAGSSGKPNKMREREDWATLVPIIEQSMEKIMQYRSIGQIDMATAMTELVRETFRRFDERIDVDAFIPPAGSESDQMSQAVAQLPQLQQQNQQLTQMVQQLQQALQQTQQQVTDRSQEIGAKKDMQAADHQHAAMLRTAEVDATNNAKLELARLEADKAVALQQSAQDAEIKKLLVTQYFAQMARAQDAQAAAGEKDDAAANEQKDQAQLAAVMQSIDQMGQMFSQVVQGMNGAMENLTRATMATSTPIRDPKTGAIVRVEKTPPTTH